LLASWPPAGASAATASDAAATVAAAGLAGLAEHSLLTAVSGPDGTRYRALETIRQYGAERLGEAGELAEARARHLRWCLAEAGALDDSLVSDWPEGRAVFDRVAGELRAAVDWVAAAPGQRASGHRLAIRLAELIRRSITDPEELPTTCASAQTAPPWTSSCASPGPAGRSRSATAGTG
jgi:predicted ATPase